MECAVSDTGLGIAQEDLGRVFNKFEQLNQPAVTGEKGSGLGLAICKGIVEMHQGHIDVKSQLGKGTTFTFTLPKRTAQDLFQQKIIQELRHAASVGGNISAVHFEIASIKKAESKNADHLFGWALDELVETIKTHGARKTDILLTDSRAVWLCLLNMTQKESVRILEHILSAYKIALEKNDLAASVQITTKRCSYPEEAKTESEFLNAL